MTEEVVPPNSWKRRRRFMYAVSGFSMLAIGYVLVTGSTTAPAATAVSMAFTTLISCVGSYVFGATWDDKGRS